MPLSAFRSLVEANLEQGQPILQGVETDFEGLTTFLGNLPESLLLTRSNTTLTETDSASLEIRATHPEWAVDGDGAAGSLTDVTLTLTLSLGEEDDSVQLGFEMRGQLHLGEVDVGSISASLSDPDSWLLEFDGEPSDGVSLAALATVAGVDGLTEDLAALGIGLPVIEDVGLGISLLTRSVSFVRCGGRMRVGDLDLEVSCRFSPELEIAAGLSQDSEISVTELLTAFSLDPTHYPEIGIDELELSILPAQQAYGAVLSLTSDWSVTVGEAAFSARGARIGVTYAAGTVTGDMQGTVQIGTDGDVDLVVAGEVAADGWSMSGRIDRSSTSPPSPISLSQVLEDLDPSGSGPVAVPDFLNGAAIEDFGFAFGTGAGGPTFELDCVARLGGTLARPTDGVEAVDAGSSIELHIAREGSGDASVEGVLTLGGLEFALVVSRQNGTQTALGIYHDPVGRPVTLGTLLGQAVGDDLGRFGEGVGLVVNDAVFAVVGGGAGGQTKVLLAVDLGAGLDLSNLPLVGERLPLDDSVRMAYRLLVASNGVEPQDVVAVNALLERKELAPLPELNDGDSVAIAARLELGGAVQLLDLPLSVEDPPTPGDDDDALPVVADSGAASDDDALPVVADSSAASDGVTWRSIQRDVGPLRFERLGAKFANGEITFLLDASLGVGGLTLSLDGLSVTSPLTEFEPRFDLRGIGLSYESGSVEVGGAFLRRTLTTEDGTPFDVYDGAALIRTKTLTLTAVGSYGDFPPPPADGQPSLFVYAILDYPLGGPAFFFVTGLAAGFGYNRDLLVPPISGVETFPLVAALQKPETYGTPSDMLDALTRPNDLVPMKVGTSWLAAGIRFSSFQLVHATALLLVRLGPDPDILIVGMARLQLPKPVPGKPPPEPYLYAELAFKVRVKPEQGVASAEALLTDNSYVIDPKCRLSGGFAFYVWFGGQHKGDFVLTLGGYHPRFVVPSHYPRVPRLAISWPVSDTIEIKGEAYFALTPSCVMAGGMLEASYRDGGLSASFTARADFLISWKPFFYDIEVSVAIRAALTSNTLFGTVRVATELSASVHIWGPEFAGMAHVEWSVLSFDVPIGAYRAGIPAYEPLTWQEFREGFLPPDREDFCQVRITSGLVRELDVTSGGEPTTEWVVRAAGLVLATEAVIPSSEIVLVAPGEDAEPIDEIVIEGPEVGVRPMGSGPLHSSHRVEVRRILDGSGSRRLIDLRSWRHDTRGSRQGVPKELWHTANDHRPPKPGAEVLPNRLVGLPGLSPRGSLTLGPPALAIETFEFDPIHPVRWLTLARQAARAAAVVAPLGSAHEVFGSIGTAADAEVRATRTSLIAVAREAGFAIEKDEPLFALAAEPEPLFAWAPMLAEGADGHREDRPESPGSLGRALAQEPPVSPAVLESEPLPEPILRTIVRLLAEIRQHRYVESAGASNEASAGTLRRPEGADARLALSASSDSGATPAPDEVSPTTLSRTLATGQSLLWSISRDRPDESNDATLSAPPTVALRLEELGGEAAAAPRPRVTLFDRYGRVVDDLDAPGQRIAVPEHVEHVVVTGRTPVERPVVSGWNASSLLIQVRPRVFVGDGVTVLTQAAYRPRGRYDEPGEDLVRGARMVAENLARAPEGAGRSRHGGWCSTRLPGHARTLGVFVRRSGNTAPETLSTRVETRRAGQHGTADKLLLQPDHVLRDAGGDLLLLYALPAGLETDGSGAITVKTQGTGGADGHWTVTGVLGIDAPVHRVRQRWATGAFRLRPHAAGDGEVAGTLTVTIEAEEAA